MTEEEKKAIEWLKGIVDIFYMFPNPQSIKIKDNKIKYVERALNLIQKQQKDIDFWKEDYNHRCQLAIDRKIELEKKDKIIDLMVIFINELADEEDKSDIFCKDMDLNYDDEDNICCQKIKQYFEKKVEDK